MDIFRKQYLNCLSIKDQKTMELNQGYPNAKHKELFKLNRNGKRKVIDFLTEYSLLKRYLTIMGVKNNPTCRGCYDNKEMGMHILWKFETYFAGRFGCLDQYLRETWELHDIPVHCLLNSASAIGLL